VNLKIYDPQDFPSYLPKLNRLYDELLTQGKGFRSHLIQKLAVPLQIPSQNVHLLCQTIEFIHNASLLHDDLVDRSPLRRGKPAAWLTHSPEYAVLAGDYLLARVMVNLSRFGNLRLVQYTAEVISDLLEGEWLQDSLVGDFQVSLSDLDRVHNLKTASLFKWCLRAPQYVLGHEDSALHQSLEEAGTLLGQLFQRGDDLLDFDVRNDEGKNPLGDLKSGYLNSFAAFSCQGKDTRALRNCESLSQFCDFLGGETIFREKVEAFDLINRDLIEVYKFRVARVPFVSGAEELRQILSPLPDLLYWRKASAPPQVHAAEKHSQI
jgi:octaprenyl-diphosphate synthase